MSEVSVGSKVIWVDKRLRKLSAIVKSVKSDNKLDLEFKDPEDNRKQSDGGDILIQVTDAHHKSIQDQEFGDYWMESN